MAAPLVHENPQVVRETPLAGIRRLWKNRFFSLERALALGLAGLVVLLAAHLLAIQAYKAMGVVKYATFWPFNTFYPHLPSIPRVVPALVALGIFAVGIRQASRQGFRLVPVLLLALATIFAANLAQGWREGFVENLVDGQTPEEGGQYWWDALEVRDPIAFIGDFTQLQPHLRIHSQTHPPGSVLVFWLGQQTLGDPALVSLAFALVSTLVSGLALHSILKREFQGDVPAFGVLLYFVFPAVQIYYLATTDALIASLFLAALAFHLHPNPRVGVPGAVLALSLAAFMTFLAGFMVLLLYLHALWTRQGFGRAVLTGGLVAAVFLALFAGLGYDYVESFRIASHVENPGGFRLVADPADYLLSRAMDVLEVLVFLGPVLWLVARRGLVTMRQARPAFHALLASAALLTGLMLLAGVFRTGETARAALFLQPFFLLAVVQGASDADATFRDRAILLTCVFLQALAMQVFGEWFW